MRTLTGPSPAPSSASPCRTASAATRAADAAASSRSIAHRKPGRQGRRVRTTGSVRRTALVARHRNVHEPLAVVERVHRLVAVPTGDDHRARAERVQPPGELVPGRGAAREHLGLEQVRRDHARQGKQPLDERLDRVLPEQPRARARDHHGIDDQRNRMRGEEVGHDLDDRGREEHARLGRVDADVGEDGLELRADELDRRLVHGRHADGVLRRQRDDDAHPVAAGRCERLQVGLDAGAAPRVGAGDRQAARNAHAPNVTPPGRPATIESCR